MATRHIDLVILGALKMQSLSAYEMDKLMEARAVRKWINISSPSIYRNLIALREKGYVEGSVVKEGSMPEKTVYTLTEKGSTCFCQLMHEMADAPVQVKFDFISVIANLYAVDENTGKQLLQTLRESHKKRAKELFLEANSATRLEAKATMELCARTYELIAEWLEEYQNNFYREGLAPALRGWVNPAQTVNASNGAKEKEVEAHSKAETFQKNNR